MKILTNFEICIGVSLRILEQVLQLSIKPMVLTFLWEDNVYPHNLFNKF